MRLYLFFERNIFWLEQALSKSDGIESADLRYQHAIRIISTLQVCHDHFTAARQYYDIVLQDAIATTQRYFLAKMEEQERLSSYSTAANLQEMLLNNGTQKPDFRPVVGYF